MEDAKSAWIDAGDRLQSLGAALKQHYAHQRGEEAGQTKDQVSDAFKKVGEALQSAFDALGAAAKDPAVKEDVKQTGKSVADALTVTFTELSEDVRKAFDKRKGDSAPEPGTPGPGTPGPGTPGAGTPDAGTPEPPTGAPGAPWGTDPQASGQPVAQPPAHTPPLNQPKPHDRQDPSSSI